MASSVTGRKSRFQETATTKFKKIDTTKKVAMTGKNVETERCPGHATTPIYRIARSAKAGIASGAVAGCFTFSWKRKRFGQKVSRLGCRSRAKRKTLLAIPALLSGNLRNEPYLASCSSFDKSDGILLLDFSTVSHAEAAENAE